MSNRRGNATSTWPDGPNVWLFENDLQGGVEFRHQVIAKTVGALIVPIGSFDNFDLGVRMYDEPHGASEVRS